MDGRIVRCSITSSCQSAATSEIVKHFRTRIHVRSAITSIATFTFTFTLCVPPLATEPSRRLLHLFGTVCRSQYAHRRHCKFFAADWRLSFPVVQQLWLRASHCTDYHVTSLLFLLATCPCSLRTYATLKFIRSSSSSSSNFTQIKPDMNRPWWWRPWSGSPSTRLSGGSSLLWWRCRTPRTCHTGTQAPPTGEPDPPLAVPSPPTAQTHAN